MIPALALVLLAPDPALAEGRHVLDADLPTPPPGLTAEPTAPARQLGTPTTVFVNFDGVTLSECNPSNSKRNCHWYNVGKTIPPFSGSVQTKVSVLQAMRRDTADFGIRITALRPPDDEDYAMVVYGGTEAQFGTLGSAPAGDCLDANPNEIAFAHVDGELVEWINGGATTALHEAAHSWGLDHVEQDHTIMFPTADDQPTAFGHGCYPVVADVALTPGMASCPELNEELCGDANAQHAPDVLERLFGGPYVDARGPTIALVEPGDGQYFQAPADFDVVLEIDDDLHPQVYQASLWLGDDPKPEPKPFIEDHFRVVGLPVGTWAFHVELADEAGNTARLDFEIEVGEDPPPEPSQEDGGCAVARSAGGRRDGSVSGAWLLVVLLPTVARRCRPR